MCPPVLKATGTLFMALIFSKHGSITLNVIDLANTLHALGYSAQVRDALLFFRWSLRASEIIFTC